MCMLSVVATNDIVIIIVISCIYNYVVVVMVFTTSVTHLQTLGVVCVIVHVEACADFGI